MEDDDDGDWADQLGSLYISRPKSTTTASASGSNYTTTSMPSPAPPPEFRKKVVPYSTVDLLLGGDDAHPPPQPPPLQRRKGESFHFGDPGDPDLEWSTQQQSQRSYHHSSSLPDDAFRARQHLPPPHHHHLQLGGASAPLFSLERIPSPSSADDEGEGHAATPGTLPEFLGSGGGQGIFKLPPRAAVHPCRPPSLEVRPHPLRETQAGTFLRTIACSPTQLWAGQENGVRFWSFDEFFSAREEGSGRVRKGDEESAPFHESSHTSPTMCLAVDAANRLVWSGHKDGKIRSWRIDHQQSVQSSASSDWGSFDSQFSSNNSNVGVARFKEGLSWQAHRAPVLSMAFTSYGDLWSGSEGGTIKIWPWETIEKALSCSAEERHIAALLAERSYVDLRSQVTVGGACPLPSVDVKFLLSDNSRLKVWSGGSLSFALWNSRTKELLKVFGIDGQIETRLDISLVQEAYGEDDTKVKFVSMSKKEKAQGPMSFFQRSRNALIGAADAVRRVATKGAFGDDTRKTEALAISINGTVWTGCANGALVQWDEHGNRLQEFQYQSCSVQCLCTYGTRLWVGYVNGSVQVLDLDGKLLGGWNAHSSPVIKMAVGGGYIFTLANHGGVRGWNLTSPGPIDDILRSELTNKEDLFTKRENIKILTGTWNVGQERASHDSLISWVGCSASEADIVVVGLQEVEMGAGVLAMAAAKETVGLEGSTNGQWWLDAIGKTLDEGTTFERVGSRQLAGLLISIWARKRLRKYIGDIDAGAVPCGFGRAIGNKGSVGLRMRVYDRILCFMNCHFAAHLEAVNRRNADFDHVYRSMSFSRPAGSSPAVQLLRVSNISSINYDDGKPELSEADLIVFLGDFNYRLHGISYDDARDSISQRSFDWLREKDQLRAEMRAGKVFQGMREGLIRFPPTYKFERHQIGLSGYDSGEKKRIPAWCDRILYRDSHSMLKDDHSMSEKESCSLKYPIVSSILEYDACMEVTDSDHKPVRCILNVDIARVDELVRRQEYGQILSSNERVRSLLKETSVPEIILSTNNIILQDQATSIVRITNRCENDNALFEISCEGESSIKDDGFASEHHPRGAFGFPRWLEVKPAAGIIKRGQIIEVSLHHEEFHTFEEYVDGAPQNSWCEDTRDKEVILVVNVTGSFTPVSKSHQIRVRHCYTKTGKSESRSNSRRIQSNLLHRSDIRNLSSTTDVDDLWCLHSP